MDAAWLRRRALHAKNAGAIVLSGQQAATGEQYTVQASADAQRRS